MPPSYCHSARLSKRKGKNRNFRPPGTPWGTGHYRRKMMEYSLTVNGEQKKMAITSPPSAPSALEDKEAVIGEQIYKFRATVIDDHKLLLSINGSQVAAYLAR